MKINHLLYSAGLILSLNSQVAFAKVRAGYVEFMKPEVLNPLKKAIPEIADADTQRIIKSPDTMWYDEESMVFLYQDSVESVVGGRANNVAWQVGNSNRDNAGIAKLMNYFDPKTFKFPFGHAAGTDEVKNVRVINFWSPPKQGGSVMPVKWWKESSRGRWRWVFPVNTVFGEVLFQKAPNGQYYVFEVRTRTRYRDGWDVNMFRPYPTARSMADAIKKLRPNWESNSSTSQLVAHLMNKNTLTTRRLASQPYAQLFKPIDGALDVLPATTDSQLIIDLLTKKTFSSVEGTIWKENGELETYGPGSNADFSIVPKGYTMGMYPVNEISCARCHEHTGRYLKDLEFDIQLYGEIWGEDRIFTWHLFKPNSGIYGTFDDVDGSRIINPNLVSAGLLQNTKPSASDPAYKILPSSKK